MNFRNVVADDLERLIQLEMKGLLKKKQQQLKL